MSAIIEIFINERSAKVTEGVTIYQLRDQIKSDADVVIYNASPVESDRVLKPFDRVVFISRGEIPTHDELQSLMISRHTPGVHEKFQQAKIGIAGLGGLGSAIAVALCRIGIGELVLADFDVVEPSNLNRQQYFIDQIGLPKTTALVENLKRINPFSKLCPHQVRVEPGNVSTLFGEVDVMIEAFDSPDAKAMLLEKFTESFPEKPIVLASGLAGFEANNTVRTRQVGENVYIVGDCKTSARPGMGLLAPRVGIAAHQQANAAVRLILGLPVCE